VFAKEDMTVDSEAMRVGNREGLSWMERIEREARAQNIIIDQLVNDSKAQKTFNSQITNELGAQKRVWYSIRATEIELNGHYQAKEAMLARSEKNEIIHGGDIVGDLEVLGFLKTEILERYDSTQKAFEAWYEISLEYRDQIVHAPELIIRTFDTLANTKSHRKWSYSRKSQEEAHKICRGIISRWLEYIDAGEGQYPGGYIRREFEKLVSLKSE
jgi:hypothetical protein